MSVFIFILFQNRKHTQRDKEIFYSLIYSLNAVPNWGPEPGIQSRSPMWVAGCSLFEPLSCSLSWCTWTGNYIGSKAAEAWTRFSNMGRKHPRGNFNFQTPAPIPEFLNMIHNFKHLSVIHSDFGLILRELPQVNTSVSNLSKFQQHMGDVRTLVDSRNIQKARGNHGGTLSISLPLSRFA